MLTAALIAVSVLTLSLSGIGPARSAAAVLGAAGIVAVTLAMKALWRDRNSLCELALLCAPFGIAAAEWAFASAGLSSQAAPTVRGFAYAAAAVGPLVALLCSALDHFLRAPHGPDEWSRRTVASAVAAAAFASAAGWALAA